MSKWLDDIMKLPYEERLKKNTFRLMGTIKCMEGDRHIGIPWSVNIEEVIQESGKILKSKTQVESIEVPK